MAIGRERGVLRRASSVLIVVLAAVIAGGLLPHGAAEADLGERRSEAEAEQRRVDQGIEEALDELEALERRHADTARELRTVERELAEIEEELARLELELAQAEHDLARAEEVVEATQGEIGRSEDELAANEAALDNQRDLFGERVRSSYQHGNVDFTQVLLDASDVNDLSRQTHLVRAFMSRDVDQMEGMQALEAAIEGVLERLVELEQRQEAERAAAEQEADRVAQIVVDQQELRAAVDAELENQRTLLAKVEADQEEYEGLVASLESQSAQIEAELREIAEAEEARRREEERRQAQREAELRDEERREEERREEERREEERREEERLAAAAVSTSRSSDGGSTASNGSGRLGRPVEGTLTSGFGYRTHPVTGGRRLHAGVDFGAPSGRPISAAEAGTVVSAGGMGGYGVTVVIDHGSGMSTLYAHQSRLAVSRGERVSRGQVIGYVGSTGLSTGPHLHFEVRINGSPVNPLPYL